ncbi:HD domain-containing protein [uncultured Maribacter sp.]|uniref:HD domain-containing protein n=1 Tax=uncultured Maribacter sp. TaxID=431308 RepID=UPI00262AC24A|nr:HD domain-containing protein [uncultured Maribacter sp.]
MNYDIVSIAKNHCMQRLSKSRCAMLQFHNLRHTIEVYQNVLKIGKYERIDLKMLEPVLLAALFHDIGNSLVFEGHEDCSCHEARSFLSKYKYDKVKIAIVCACINATKMPQKPYSKFENIICDADLYHLGTKMFFTKCELLRREWSDFKKVNYSDEDWKVLNVCFLEKHKFHTSYGKNILDPIKQENIKLLKTGYKRRIIKD